MAWGLFTVSTCLRSSSSCFSNAFVASSFLSLAILFEKVFRSAGFLFGVAEAFHCFPARNISVPADLRKGIPDLRTPVSCPVCVAYFAGIFLKDLLFGQRCVLAVKKFSENFTGPVVLTTIKSQSVRCGKIGSQKEYVWITRMKIHASYCQLE